MKLRITSLTKLFFYSILSSGITYLLMFTGAFENGLKYIFFSLVLIFLVGLDMARDYQMRVLRKHLLEMERKAEKEAFENSREQKLKKQFDESGYNYWDKYKDK